MSKPTVSMRRMESNLDFRKEHDSGVKIHYGYRCDSCDADPILGNRYTCESCGDVDLCKECFDENVFKSERHGSECKIKCIE